MLRVYDSGHPARPRTRLEPPRGIHRAEAKVAVLGDFEGRPTSPSGWGNSSCPTVSEFSSPTQLVIDFTF